MQQTPVRFYITQDDDRPIVRTIPVTTHPIPQAPKPAQASDANLNTTQNNQSKSRVAKLVRSVKRSDAAR